MVSHLNLSLSPPKVTEGNVKDLEETRPSLGCDQCETSCYILWHRHYLNLDSSHAFFDGTVSWLNASHSLCRVRSLNSQDDAILRAGEDWKYPGKHRDGYISVGFLQRQWASESCDVKIRATQSVRIICKKVFSPQRIRNRIFEIAVPDRWFEFTFT